MRLPHDQYLIFREANEKLLAFAPSDLATCYITVNKFGEVEEHDDEIFDEGPLWFSYGTTKKIGQIEHPVGTFPDDVWHLLRRRIDP